MQRAELRELLHRYAHNRCTKKEERFLEDLVLRKPMMKWDWDSEEAKTVMRIRIKNGIDARIFAKRRVLKRRIRFAIAASILLLLGLGILYQFNREYLKADRFVINESADMAQDNVILTLSNGKQVDLEVESAQVLEPSGGVVIKRTADGLVYEEGHKQSVPTNQVGLFNTIQVPNGKQCQLMLPDGTKVWLNTASTLRFPVAFNGQEREVVLSGEAYFDVAQDKARPFRIAAHDATIEVIGTQFNVSAYQSDDKVITTLISGGVNVRNTHSTKKVQLKPGDQSIAWVGQDKIYRDKANIEQALAWKDGYFVFENKDLISVMRTVARWYGIRITVEGQIPATKFGGTFPMDSQLDELLADLERLTKVRFTKNGKEVQINWKNTKQ
ncbi:hypothetical protein GCM10023231_04540 [Olivibacter ginsenosidimutans]|uniref:DUF4974 domain-containing protein n=1 Tax=Olivibacter ginsenosidimutans TaxID=1176537 RepID=A0ABP9AG06_9SPHI